MPGFIVGLTLLASTTSAEPPSTCLPVENVTTVIVEPLEATVDHDLVARIIQCESGWNAKAKNPTSSAKGLFQIIDGTWRHFECEGDPLNGSDNYRCGMKILEKNGTRDWDASKPCWQL